jgi:DNA processing protein
MEKKIWLALSKIEGVGPAVILKIIAHLGSPDKLLEASIDDCTSLDVNPGKIRKVFDGLRRSDPDFDYEHLMKLGARCVTWDDEEYPQNLRQIYDPPLVLYVKGELLKRDNDSIAIVGARKASAYGRSIAEMLAQALAQRGITVVSGMARGIDASAHKGALMGSGRTIAVLGCGTDLVYPPENKRLKEEIENCGAIVSEYSPGTEPLKHHFPARNRIIAGMTLGTLVVEASLKSGSLITADFAMDFGREVFAVPGNIYDDLCHGPHRLIKDGAKLVEGVQDILEELRIEKMSAPPESSRKADLSDIERTILLNLPRQGKAAANLSEDIGLDAEKVLAQLSLMEMKGLIRRSTGNLYVPAL